MFLRYFFVVLIFLNLVLEGKPKVENVFFITSERIIEPSFSKDAMTRDEANGLFLTDFLLLHCLIKKYQPKTFFEIGTCEGVGTRIIKNAMGSGTVYSLELPPGVSKYALSRDTIGAKCNLPYVQLLGDSMTYDYEKHYPIYAWFIDGEHDYDHVFYESAQALLSQPILCIWHDTDIPEVFQAVLDTFGQSENYNIYRVIDSRVTYAIDRSKK